jgi:hypothetical protein
MNEPLTPDEEKEIQEFLRIKKRGADGKRLRPCDVVVTFAAQEQEELAQLPLHTRRTEIWLKQARQGHE